LALGRPASRPLFHVSTGCDAYPVPVCCSLVPKRGDRVEARGFTAGQSPKTSPIPTDTPNPIPTAQRGTDVGIDGSRKRPRAPSAPPLRRGTARRTPISFVRSVTSTGRMFITPTPLTRRPAPEIGITTSARIACICRNVSKIASGVEVDESDARASRPHVRIRARYPRTRSRERGESDARSHSPALASPQMGCGSEWTRPASGDRRRVA